MELVFCLLIIFLGKSLAYNLATNKDHKGVVILDDPTGEPNSTLFGWSVHFDPKFKDKRGAIFVGAPEFNSTGGIFSCSTNNGVCSVDLATNTRKRDRHDGWLGASIAGDNGAVYSCAPFLDNKYCMKPKTCCENRKKDEYKNGNLFKKCDCETETTCCEKEKIKSRIFGECYKFNTNKNEFARFTEIRYADKISDIPKLWSRSGPFGYAIEVAEDGALVLGAPISTTLLHHYELKPDTERSGTIVKYKEEAPKPKTGAPKGSLVFPDANKAPFSVQKIEMDEGIGKMRNTLNLAGMSFVKAYIDKKFVYLIGAPKADNNRGKAHICMDCFTSSIKGFELKADPQESQIGERFGETVAACDINGDKNDDVIVGAPFYTKTEEDYNVGRVYVFLTNKNIHQNDGSKISVSPFVPAVLQKDELTPKSRFGSAMACLGDTDGDGFQEVAVGAPYYSEDKGAVYIFRGSISGLRQEPSQVLKASSLSNKIVGFGISLFSRGSVDCPPKKGKSRRVPDCSQCHDNLCNDSKDCELRTFSKKDKKSVCVSKNQFGSQNGLTVGSHMSQNVVHMEFRKVTRIVDATEVEAPSDYDPENSKIIRVKVTPKLWMEEGTEVATYQDVLASVTVIMDKQKTKTVTIDRIVDKQQTKTATIREGELKADTLEFEFTVKEIDLTVADANVRKAMVVHVKVEWKLSPCQDSMDKLCSIMDPNQVTTFQPQVSPIVIKTGCSKEGCHCRIKSSMSIIKPTLVAGEKQTEHIGDLSISNYGSEPAFRTKVSITLSPSTIKVANEEQYCSRLNETSFLCAHIDKRKGGEGPSNGDILDGDDASGVQRKVDPSTLILPITLDVASIGADINDIQMSMNVVSDCIKAEDVSTENGSVILKVDHEWKISTKPLDQDGDSFNWDWTNHDLKTHKIIQKFQVVNDGPSESSGGELFVFVPKSSSLLSHHNAKLTKSTSSPIQCQDAQNKQIPDEIKKRSCTFNGLNGDCIVKKCNIPILKQKQTADLVVSLTFNLENAKNNEKENVDTLNEFEVITTVQTIDGQNKESLSEYVSKLEYQKKNFLTTLTNYWYVLVGAVIGIIFIIIICLILYRCNIFNRIRIYKDDIEEVNNTEELGMGMEKVDSKEEATFEQRVEEE